MREEDNHDKPKTNCRRMCDAAVHDVRCESVRPRFWWWLSRGGGFWRGGFWWGGFWRGWWSLRRRFWWRRISRQRWLWGILRRRIRWRTRWVRRILGGRFR